MTAGPSPRRFGALVVGLCAGAATAANWRPLVKGAVKVGIVGSAKLTRAALGVAEDVVDLVHEARSELAQGSRHDTDDDAGRATVTAMFHGA